MKSRLPSMLHYKSKVKINNRAAIVVFLKDVFSCEMCVYVCKSVFCGAAYFASDHRQQSCGWQVRILIILCIVTPPLYIMHDYVPGVKGR